MYPLDLETSQDYSRNQFSLCAHNETSTSVQTYLAQSLTLPCPLLSFFCGKEILK